MKPAAKIITVNVLATFALLLVLEGASRLIRPVDFPDPVITKKRSGWIGRQYDPNLFWTMRPHAFMWGRTATNSLGLRGPEIPPKDPHEFRILSLGESSTWGVKVRDEETYSSLLEEVLPAVEGKRVQVINAGVPGYTLFQGFTYLRLRGLALKPDAVLIYFGFNDFLPMTFRAERDAGSTAQSGGLTDREVFAQRRTLRYRFTYALQRRSNLVRLLSFHGVPARARVVLEAKRPRVPASDRRWLLSELRGLARAHGFRLVVVIPWYKRFDKHEPLLRELTAWSDITVIDLPEQFSTLPGPRARFFLDAVHPNPAGHRLIAQGIAEHLRRRWDLSGVREGE